MAWLFVSILIIFEILADIFAKEYSIKERALFYTLSIGCYMLANVAWLESMRRGMELSKGGLIFSVGTAITAVVIGRCMYEEEVTRMQMSGMLLGIVSLALIMWNE